MSKKSRQRNGLQSDNVSQRMIQVKLILANSLKPNLLRLVALLPVKNIHKRMKKYVTCQARPIVGVVKAAKFKVAGSVQSVNLQTDLKAFKEASFKDVPR